MAKTKASKRRPPKGEDVIGFNIGALHTQLKKALERLDASPNGHSARAELLRSHIKNLQSLENCGQDMVIDI